MKRPIQILIVCGLVLLLICLGSELAHAQCAMCKATSESNLKAGGGDPKGLNTGILYMFILPYLIVGSIGFWWYRNRKQGQPELQDALEQ